MLPELGLLALILALILAVLLGTLPMLGAHRGQADWMATARPLAYSQVVFIGLAFALLAHAFVTHDFSVAYVATNSNTLLPTVYQVTAVWGAHEGSLLLWVLILSLWIAAVARFSRSLPAPVVARVLAVMGWVSAGFLAFLLFTSNPFERLLPAAMQGRDLNPLLQDPGMIVHPPLLYTGYVGFAVAFAFAIAALIDGKVDTQWVRWSRPWTNVAWGFLTLGIALGSWWAYYELGWGGWWFWDPVENASFMPWLAGAALLHSAVVTERRGALAGWTTFLALLAFTFSMLGAFLVRSGVLMTEGGSIEKDVAARPGQSFALRGYDFRFDGVERVQGPNYQADRGSVHVSRGGDAVATLHPEKRAYASGGNIMTEADIHGRPHRDLYVALGDSLGPDGSWALRLYVKPFIRLIWIGALLMALGGFVVVFDGRFRRAGAKVA